MAVGGASGDSAVICSRFPIDAPLLAVRADHKTVSPFKKRWCTGGFRAV
jgi:hypothetical protein